MPYEIHNWHSVDPRNLENVVICLVAKIDLKPNGYMDDKPKRPNEANEKKNKEKIKENLCK